MDKLFGEMISVEKDEGEASENDLLVVHKLIKGEMAVYKSEKTLNINSDPLAWWQVNAPRFPHLATLARIHMVVAATSVPSERIFSAAGNLINAKRACLSSPVVDRLIFLNKNCKYF